MSGEDAFSDRPASVSQYLAIARRRLWILLALPLMTAAIAYALSTTQSARYKATAKVIVNRSNIVALITDVQPDTTAGVDPTRYLTTQATVAQSPALAKRVVDASGVPGLSAGRFLSESDASAESNADILDLSVSDASPGRARLLTNTYAEEFARFKQELDTEKINDAIHEDQLQLNSLRKQGKSDTSAYAELFQELLRLKTVGGQLTNTTSVLQGADTAAKTRPLPRRNGLIGGLLGALIGIGLAFLAEAVDKRVRTEQEFEQALGLPLLGRLLRPSRRLRKRNELVMLREPGTIQAEMFRKLRTSLEFVNFEHSARTIMLTSAVPREGKSTTAANLAVALARAGRRVALVDLDLRRPYLHTFFNVRSEPGSTDFVIGRADLADVTREIAIPSGNFSARPATLTPGRAQRRGSGRSRDELASLSSNGRGDARGVLDLLPCGTIPRAAAELLERDRVATLLEELSAKFDMVIVDAPPLLAVGDAQALTAKVDAVVVVTQLGLHRRQLHELARQLQNSPALILGFVLTGLSARDSYGYGYGYGYGYDLQADGAARAAKRPINRA